MAFGEFYVQRECWAKWPNVLWMVRKRGDGNERRRYLPERTCRNELRGGFFKCSECGLTVSDSEYFALTTVCYCPSCGARVLSEEEQGHMVADAIRGLEKAVEG